MSRVGKVWYVLGCNQMSTVCVCDTPDVIEYI